MNPKLPRKNLWWLFLASKPPKESVTCMEVFGPDEEVEYRAQRLLDDNREGLTKPSVFAVRLP